MAYRSISPANANLIPVGSRVRFEYGPMHGSAVGTITGYWLGKTSAVLIAETDEGERREVGGISNVGIGIYLTDAALSAAFLGEGA